MTYADVPPPLARFPDPALTILFAGTALHRTHARTFGPAQFNPCLGQPSRFAPFTDPSGACVPTLYAATTQEAAAFESIFHDIAPAARYKTVRLDTIVARAVSTIVPTRDLRLINLFAPDLKAWGLERANLIDTPKSTYLQTALWAAALHAAFPDIDGLIWTSRQCDPDRCVVLFGDRTGEQDFAVTERLEVARNAALLLTLRGYGRRAGIDIVN